jgi:hypothetical protein
MAERLNLPTDIASQALFLIPQTVDNPRDAMSEFATTMSAEEEVTYITSPSIDGKTSGLVVVPAKDSTPNNFYLTPFIDTHSRLIAWWLTTFWRSLDLAKSTWELAEANRFISASACSRSLLETSAAFWCEVIEIADLWRKIKLRGITKVSAINDWRELNNWVWQTTYGGKFDSRAPDLEKQWANLQKTNVLTYIGRLAKSCPNIDLQEQYQWLCNTVHPSCGGTFAMSTPLVAHASNTHAFAWFAPFPTHMESTAGQTSERRVQEAIAVSAIVAVRVMEKTLDDSLRIIDDLGLTTSAPKMATFKYWRQLQVGWRQLFLPLTTFILAGLEPSSLVHHRAV